MQRTVASIEVMQLMTNNGLKLYKKVGSRADINKRMRYEDHLASQGIKKGVVFVSSSKDNLMKGKGHVVTSYETLQEQKNKLTHWTPNIFRGGSYYDFKNRIIKGHTRDNLKQINTIGFDIDTKEVDLYDLFDRCTHEGLPWPNCILETPKGYQGFFILETPFYIHKKNDYKAIRVAESLADNILDALNTYVPIDLNCAPFGFYRIPNDSNIIYFNDKVANTSSLIQWSIDYSERKRKSRFQVIYNNASDFAPVRTDWYKTLLRNTGIHKGHYSSSRNNALLTLGIANYASGISYEDAYDVLDQFNSNLDSPLSLREFERTLKSAYSGKYKAPKRSYVEGLLEMWSTTDVKFQGKEGWYKFKKCRDERTRSHYDEWEDDIIAYLENQVSPSNPYYESSLRNLALEINIPLSTLKEVLKQSNKIKKSTTGKGRYAQSYFTTRSILIRNLLYKRKTFIHSQQLIFNELDYLQHLVVFEESILAEQINKAYNSGASPPIRHLSS